MRSAFCNHCDGRRSAVWQYPRVGLHSILLVATCGLWLPVWFFIVAFGGKYVCAGCGSGVRVL